MQEIGQGYFQIFTKNGIFGFRMRPCGEGVYLFVNQREEKIVNITWEELALLADTLEEAWSVHSAPIRACLDVTIDLSMACRARAVVLAYVGSPVNLLIQFLKDPMEELPEVQSSEACLFEEEAQVRAFVNAVRFFKARYKITREEKGSGE